MMIGRVPLHDPQLPRLAGLSSSDLQQALSRAVPKGCLDSSPAHYRVETLRYTPGKKVVLSLMSPRRRKPVGMRIFRPGTAPQRFEKARRARQTPAFLLDDIDAVAWIFPGERKLKLDIVADPDALTRLLRRERGFELQRCSLVRYVPEHTYTARLEGVRLNARAAIEYLKISYDDSGERTALLNRELAAQTDDLITVAGDASYVREHRMLIQGALPLADTEILAPAQAAAAFARFHGLVSSLAAQRSDVTDAALRTTRALLAQVRPRLAARADRIIRTLRARRVERMPHPPVLTHGDVHPGNLLRLKGGQVGFIDLDSVALGDPEDDLASYFAYLLWLDIREHRSPRRLADGYCRYIDHYNHAAPYPVSCTRARLALATMLITQRLRRAIVRGKFNDPAELECLLQLAARFCADDEEPA